MRIFFFLLRFIKRFRYFNYFFIFFLGGEGGGGDRFDDVLKQRKRKEGQKERMIDRKKEM